MRLRDITYVRLRVIIYRGLLYYLELEIIKHSH